MEIKPAQTNYWTQKDSTLLELLAERKLTIEGKDRKSMISALQKWDIEHGIAVEAMEESDTGEMVPIEKSAWDDLDEETKKQYKLRTVIFHSNSEYDLPYVFIGHNGRSFYFPRDKEVKIPQIFLDSCVKDAVEHRLETIGSGKDLKFRVKQIQRVPYTLVE